MRYQRDVPGRPGDLTALGDVEELAEMIGNEGSELVDCCTVAPTWPAEGSSQGEAKKPQRGYHRRHAEGGTSAASGRWSPFLQAKVLPAPGPDQADVT
jgi:hypothetical protein